MKYRMHRGPKQFFAYENMPRQYKKTGYAGARGRRTVAQQMRDTYRAAQRAAYRKSYAANNRRTAGYIGLENKFLDSELVPTDIPVTWTTLNPTASNSISVPAQGDGESNRDGRVYHINSIHVHGTLVSEQLESQVTPQFDQFVKIALYLDTQTNGAEAAGGDIMDNSVTSDRNSFRNLQNSKRFRVLRMLTVPIKLLHMNEGGANLFAVAGCFTPFEMNYKFKKPIKVRCTGTTEDVASCSDNNIGICAIASNNNPQQQISYVARCRFTG